jgi:hypothetical protein
MMAAKHNETHIRRHTMNTDKPIRLGKVVFDLGYVINIENEEMEQHARECIMEDIEAAMRCGELSSYIRLINEHDLEQPEKVTAGDIPEFLTNPMGD